MIPFIIIIIPFTFICFIATLRDVKENKHIIKILIECIIGITSGILSIYTIFPEIAVTPEYSNYTLSFDDDNLFFGKIKYSIDGKNPRKNGTDYTKPCSLKMYEPENGKFYLRYQIVNFLCIFYFPVQEKEIEKDAGIIISNIGDVNSDGLIDASDSSCILDIYSNNSTQKNTSIIINETADVNQDGFIDSADASLVLDYYSASSVGQNEKPYEFFQKHINSSN